jgi:SAM-dependent methyltransferase
MASVLPIVNPHADERFRKIAQEMSLDPDGLWVGKYVDYEWQHIRHVLEAQPCNVRGKFVLELGCNVGATSIVLAALGAKVAAIDVDAGRVELAGVNAARYGFAEAIDFAHVPDTTRMPFPAESFDVICCNSVLEYVPLDVLAPLLKEIDRVLRGGGLLIIYGTSNRLWPREVHSRRWFVNYLPRSFDSVFLRGRSLQRGVWPWQLRSAFAGYEDLIRKDRGRGFLEVKSRAGLPPRKRRILSAINRVADRCGVSVGILMPSCCLLLRKPERSVS